MENSIYPVSCRVCLNNEDSMHPLFSQDNAVDAKAPLAEMLESCTQVQVTADDGLPDQICYMCTQELYRAFKFKEKCRESDLILRQNAHYKHHIASNKSLDTSYTDDSLEEILKIDTEDTLTTNCMSGTFEEKQQGGHHESSNATKLDNKCKNNIWRKTQSPVSKTNKNVRKTTGPHTCPQCNKELKTYSSLKYHMQLHSNDTPYLCSQCGEGFKTKNSYDGHMSMHDIGNSHRCDQCGKRYRQAASLRNHIMTHTGERPHLCMICGKGCIQKSDFKKHMLTHTTEKPYVCNICGHEYRFSHNLKLHMRTHTGERPYDCKVCNKRFSAKDHLKRHSIVHTGEKPYSCDFCDKSFNRASTLAMHRKIHTGQRDHICKVCGKSFIQAHCLLAHMNTHSNRKSGQHPVNEAVPVVTTSELKKVAAAPVVAEIKLAENVSNEGTNIVSVVLNNDQCDKQCNEINFVNITKMVIEPDMVLVL